MMKRNNVVSFKPTVTDVYKTYRTRNNIYIAKHIKFHNPWVFVGTLQILKSFYFIQPDF